MRQTSDIPTAYDALVAAVINWLPIEPPRDRADRILRALAAAGFAIVPKPQGRAEAVREAIRTGNWSGISDRDLLAWRDAPCEGENASAWVARTVPLTQDAVTAAVETLDCGEVAETGRKWESDDGTDWSQWQQRPRETVDLEPALTVAYPPGAVAPEPERDRLGLFPRSAEDLADRYGCRVAITGMDDADCPLTDDDEGLIQYVVVTARATGRLVGMVEAWTGEGGDPLVPRDWLTTVLSAWDAASDPQPKAA